MTTQAEPTIHVVDDDDSFRIALGRLLRSEGYTVALHASAAGFLAAAPHGPGCLLLDVDMPDCNGPDLQARLATRGDVPPIVFLTGKGDIASSVKAIKAGAEDYLTKPVEVADLLDALTRALERDAAARCARAAADSLHERWARLTARERQVFEGVVRGLLNKQIAHQLGAAERTIKAHRQQVMTKLGARSVPDLVLIAEALRRDA
jgi:FixJ family two-component response regulator